MSAIGMEVHKLKRRRYWLMAAGAVGVELAFQMNMMLGRVGKTDGANLLVLSLNDLFLMCVMVVPLVAALLASRLTMTDTEERMGQLLTALGQREGTRFAAKLVVGSFTVALGQVAIVAFTSLIGPGMGLRVTAAYQDTFWPSLIIILAASVAVMAVQLVLAICFEKQAIGLCVGALGGFVCSGLSFVHLEAFGWLLPWGIAAAATPVSTADSYKAGTFVGTAHPWINVLLAIVATVVWSLLARLIIAYKENHR